MATYFLNDLQGRNKYGNLWAGKWEKMLLLWLESWKELFLPCSNACSSVHVKT